MCAVNTESQKTLHHQHIGCAAVSETLPNKRTVSSAKPTSYNLQIKSANLSFNGSNSADLKFFCLPERTKKDIKSPSVVTGSAHLTQTTI